MPLQLKEKWQALSTAAKVRWTLLVIAVLITLGWLLWLRFTPAPQAVTTYQAVHTAVPVANLEKVPVPGPKVIYVYPSPKAQVKLDAPAQPREVVAEATDVKPGKNAAGSRVVTFLNTTTGQFRTVAKDIPRPWIAFERSRDIGVGYGLGRYGQMAAVRYQQDILRVLSVTVSAEVQGTYHIDKNQLEGSATGWLHYRP